MSLRHFVLSLAAVFVALAVGVVLGARVLSDPLAIGPGGLEQEVRQQERVDDTAALTERLAAADEFDTTMSSRIVRDALRGKSVVVFLAPGADEGDVAALTGLVTAAGGTLTGTVGLTPDFVDGDASEKLRSVVVSPIVPAGTQLSTTLTDAGAQAGDLLGIALLINRDPAIAPVDAAARDTVLAALRDTGFVTYPQYIGPADAAVVVTGGALADDAGSEGATVARFAAALAPHGSGVVLAGRDGSANEVSAVGVARADPALAGAVTTVDDIGTAAGRITTVLAVQSLLGGSAPQKYGVGPGAAAVTVGE